MGRSGREVTRRGWWVGLAALLALTGCRGGGLEGDETPTSSPVPQDSDQDGVPDGADCDPADPKVYPGAIELCDGRDNDCDLQVDEDAPGAVSWYADLDGDGFGDSSQSTKACQAPDKYVGRVGDCDDTDELIYPNAAEHCDDVDSDCDLRLDDPEVVDPPTWYFDGDGDGYGVESVTSQGCAAPKDYEAMAGDCDDANVGTFPGAIEQCDGKDNDCNQLIDDNVGDQESWPDEDGDGFGAADGGVMSCVIPEGHVTNNGDCNDEADTINPDALEQCNQLDDDCDLEVDEGLQYTACSDWYRALTVPVARGLKWSQDNDFWLEQVTVPSVLVLHEGKGYRLFAKSQVFSGAVMVFRSLDGMTWVKDEEPVLKAETFDNKCGQPKDVAEVYLPDGSYRLLVEGWVEESRTSVICSVWSADGDNWVAEPGIRFAGGPQDSGKFSVLSVLWWAPTAEYWMYYVGDLYYEGENGNGIRRAISTDGYTFTAEADYNLLQIDDVDPCPVRIEEGGLRLYHTHPMAAAQLGVADSPDGLNFTDMGVMVGFEAPCANNVAEPAIGDDCRYDTFFLRLPDDRLVLYTGTFKQTEDGQHPGVSRAVAID